MGREIVRKIINGIVVEVEIDREMDEKLERYITASKVMSRIGFPIDGCHASTIGKGKHTQSMRKGAMAKEYNGVISRKAWRKRLAEKEQKICSSQS